MIAWRWINSLSPGTEQAVYWGCAAAATKGSRNYSGVCNPQIDQIIAQLTTANSYEDLTSTAQKLDRMIMEQFLFVPLYYTGVDYVARWPHIQRPGSQSLYGMVLETWWQEQKQ
jgi:ABC-type oligopeptide transport system substrate-binding subunit